MLAAAADAVAFFRPYVAKLRDIHSIYMSECVCVCVLVVDVFAENKYERTHSNNQSESHKCLATCKREHCRGFIVENFFFQRNGM